jgi:drug/metabolite transporter (DMT)-like permease
MSMNKETLGTLLAIVTALFSGIAIPTNKVFVVNMDPIVFTAVRSIIIGVIFLVLVQWQFRAVKKQKNKQKNKIIFNWKYLAGIAIIGGAIAFALYFTGLKLTTAARAAFLHKTLPLYTALLAFLFLKEKLTKKYLSAMALMIIGTVAIYSATINPSDLWSNPQLGDLLVISATILWAVENVLAKKAINRGSTNFLISFSRMFFGGLILFGVVLLTGKAGILLTLTTVQIVNILISTGLLLAYVFFYYWSLRLINVSKAAVMLLLAPVVSLVISIAVLHEPASMLQLVGSLVILIGAYLVTGIKSEQREV